MKLTTALSCFFLLVPAFLLDAQLINTDSWKLLPTQVAYSGGNTDFENALLSGSLYTTTLDFNSSTTSTLSIKLPALANPGMLVYNVCHNCSKHNDPKPHTTDDVSVVAYVSDNSTDGTDGTWNLFSTVPITIRLNDLQKFDIPLTLSNRWIRLEFTNNKTIDLGLKEFGLYEFRNGDDHNYFLLLGASIMENSGGYSEFIHKIDEFYGPGHGYEPVIFNLAISGTRIRYLRNNIDSFLASHPYAKFVMIHIGGNNVTGTRPLEFEDLESEELEIKFVEYLKEIIQKVENSGKIPLLARLTFRDYRSNPRVEGGLYQSYGSLPYNWQIDGVIKEMTPEFYDTETGRGMFDFYELTLNNQSYIAGDGVHPANAFKLEFIEYWVKTAINYVYTGNFPEPVAYMEVLPNLTDSLAQLMSIAETSNELADVYSARLIADQIADHSTRLAAHQELDDLSAVILPVDILDYAAEDMDHAIRLQWSTASESNNNYFTIEKSVDGTGWIEIAKIPGSGSTSSVSHYFFDDTQPYIGSNFYQLSQTDFDGTTEYLGIKRIDRRLTQPAVSIYPIPSPNFLKIRHRSNSAPRDISFYQLDGREVLVQPTTLNGETIIRLHSVPTGIYLLNFQINGSSQTQKVVVN